MKKSLFAFCLFTTVGGSFALSAKYHEPYEGSRIYWDVNSQREVFPSGAYARIAQLQDGRLMAVTEGGGGVLMSFSSDNGSQWSAPELLIRGTDRVPIAVPDLVQLADGTIIVGYNPRPARPYSEERKFGIRVLRSTDNGKSWSEPIFVFDAQHTFGDGCWEPSFLELPSGELHLYFANENPFTASDEQEISVCRSFDMGETWSAPERVSFRAGSRDGMPSAIITDAGEIVVSVEDNGHPGYPNFRVTTMRCKLEDNWKEWVDASSPNRNMIFANEADKKYISAAPYIRKLKNGETIASWQGNYGDRSSVTDLEYMDMFVAVGDKDARNFKAISQPFAMPLSHHGFWNSLSVAGDGTVFAISSLGEAHKGSAVNIMKGYAMSGFEAGYGTPEIDGSFVGETWTAKNAAQVFMGVKTRNRATMDFLYDNDNLYFFGRVIDRTIFTDKSDNDGIFLYLDLANACDTYPQEGMFRLFLNANGEVELSSGGNNRWIHAETPAGVKFVAKLQKNYYDMELAIPWKALGFDAPPVDKLMRCNIEVRDRRADALILETIPETINRQSWTWPEFRLNKDAGAGIDNECGVAVGGDNAAAVSARDGELQVCASREIAFVRVYSSAGVGIASSGVNAFNAKVSLPGAGWLALVRIIYADGVEECAKVVVL